MPFGPWNLCAERDSRSMFCAADCAERADRQDGADLVVGVHDGNQARVLADSVFHLLRRHGADGANGEQFDLEALFFELFQRVQHGVVLERGRNDVLFALALAEARGREDGLIVGLAAAGGEVNFARGSVQGLGRLLADGVQARGVAVDRFHIGEHGVDRCAAHLGRRGVIRVNCRHCDLLCC